MKTNNILTTGRTFVETVREIGLCKALRFMSLRRRALRHDHPEIPKMVGWYMMSGYLSSLLSGIDPKLSEEFRLFWDSLCSEWSTKFAGRP